jgi:Winged helix DNA-binding domain
VTTPRDIARWRLRSQLLAGEHATSATAVLEQLLAVQAENVGQTSWAVACRTTSPRATDLAGLVDDGDVVRTHVLRPTWHYVAARDIGWLLELTAPRVRPVVVRQLTQAHGLTSAEIDRAVATVVDVLSERPDRTRNDLARGLHERGLPLPGHALMLLLAVAELDQLVCSGRCADGAHTYALFADRVRDGRRLDRDEALAELALRYFTGHGPATERDLAYWATLPLGDVRRGLAQVGDRLDSFEHDGRTFWHEVGSSPPRGPSEPAGHLLQILDEIYRGYQDSRMVLDSAGRVPVGRESAIGMALVDGQMVGAMKRTVARKVLFEIAAYDGRLAPDQRDALDAAAARYADFLGLEHELHLR